MKRIVSAIAVVFTCLTAFTFSADAWRAGAYGPPLSKRVSINMYAAAREFAFINHIKGNSQWGPVGNSYATGTPFNQSIDANGYPNVPNARTFGIAMYVPSSLNFTGPYVLSWSGKGRAFFNDGTWTLNVGASSNCTQTTTNTWSGTNAYCVLTFSGSANTNTFLYSIQITQSDPDSTGANVTDLKFYRLEDETDLKAGKVFRKPWKQTLVDYNPSWVRFLNWGLGQNNSPSVRWEHRTKPSYANYMGAWNFVSSPRYGESAGTNQFTLSSVTGTPSAMQHGELATFRIGNNLQRPGRYGITAMTKDATGGVATYTLANAVTDPVNGDKVQFYLFDTGMTQLQYRVATISSVNTSAKTFKTDIDTSGFSTLTVTGGAVSYVSMNIGGRGEYPIVFMNGTTPVGNYGNYMIAGEYTNLVFDKTLTALTDSSGNPVYGVWLFPDLYNVYAGSTPIEIQIALVNELNEMMPKGTISAYLQVGHMSLLSMDPDYSEASDPVLQSYNTVFNGANGYKGLLRGNLFLEYSNETWNAGGSAFYQTFYLARKGQLRWGGGNSDYVSMHSLRTYIAMKSIAQKFGTTNTRFKRIMAGQGAQGWSGLNTGRINGSSNFLNDPLVTPGDTPMTYHDGFVIASYIYAQSSWMTDTMPGLATAWDGAGRPSSGSQIDSMVAALSTTSIGGSQTLESYAATAATMASNLNNMNKFFAFYEGGWDTYFDSRYTQTQADYMVAVHNSTAWATAIVGYYTTLAAITNLYSPSEYIELNLPIEGGTRQQQWGHAYPSLYGTGNSLYPSGTEGSGLNPAWLAIGAFNQAQSP